MSAIFEVTICDLKSLSLPQSRSRSLSANLAPDVTERDMPSAQRPSAVPIDQITGAIVIVRGHKVLLDADLASLYGVPTKVLVQAVKRNGERFPDDFMLQLTAKEWEDLRSQFVTSKPQRGGRRYSPIILLIMQVASSDLRCRAGEARPDCSSPSDTIVSLYAYRTSYNLKAQGDRIADVP